MYNSIAEGELPAWKLILQAAKVEFLEKGFQFASLGQIATAAGVITGAFYRCYSSEEAVFKALVGKQCTSFTDSSWCGDRAHIRSRVF